MEVWHSSRGATSCLQIFFFSTLVCCQGIYWKRWKSLTCSYMATLLSTLFYLSSKALLLVNCNPMSLLKQSQESLSRDAGFRLNHVPHFYLQAEMKKMDLFYDQLWCTFFMKQRKSSNQKLNQNVNILEVTWHKQTNVMKKCHGKYFSLIIHYQKKVEICFVLLGVPTESH